jgi:DNA invertase Pin-like site-specific DNA recombinase
MTVMVYSLTLGVVDLTSPAGKMTMQLKSAVAGFKRDWDWVIREPETTPHH